MAPCEGFVSVAAWPGVQFEDAISASQITGGADRGEMGSAVGLTVGWTAGRAGSLVTKE